MNKENLKQPELSEPIKAFRRAVTYAMMAVLIRHLEQHQCGPGCEIMQWVMKGQKFEMKVTHQQYEGSLSA